MSLSNFPESFDTNQNLYLVHDYLRLKLAEDYTPGDDVIYVYGSKNIMSVFPNTSEGGGIITLVDQCDDVLKRAISFNYTSRTNNDQLDITQPWQFIGLKLIKGENNEEVFQDVKKYKNVTTVCQNVIAQHHNSLKDAIINIQSFAGIEGKIASLPERGTMEERINYLRKLVLGPRAWFGVDKNISIYPFSAVFNDLSFGFGTDGLNKKTTYTWFFDLSKQPDGTYSPNSQDSVLIYEKLSSEKREIKYTYNLPGYYTVGLKLENEFGSDFVVFEKMINVRCKIPNEAKITISEAPNQINYGNSKRCGVGESIQVSVSDGGQITQPVLDIIKTYTWNIADDLNHFNNSTTKCSFSVGGKYDVGLRVDTNFGNFRITTFPEILDIVEKTNLWLWTINSNKDKIINHEFGLISETFKTLSEYDIEKIDDSFIKSKCDVSSFNYSNLCRQLREFNRNNGFAKTGTTLSGDRGSSLIYWASGRSGAFDNSSVEKIRFRKFTGFTQVYQNISISGDSYLSRPWNWVDFATPYNLYFCYGKRTTESQETNNSFSKINLSNFSLSSFSDIQYSNFGDELKTNTITECWQGSDLVPCSSSNIDYRSRFSSQRSCWKDGSGYILRNEGEGNFFRFRNFYKTSGVTINEINTIRRISDLSGPVKSEGQLLSMSDGVFLFNNSGSISIFNTSTNVWATGGPGNNSSEFRFLQDVNKPFFDDQNQTLLATTDNDQTAYLSYDYSQNSFIKFNNVDLTFKYIGSRPEGDQWQLRCY